MRAPLIDAKTVGVFTVVATPFADNGELDLESTDRLIDFYIDSSVQGLTILGVLGEAHKLTDSETQVFADRVLSRVNGRVPVIVGCSKTSFVQMREAISSATELGAAGIMIAPAPHLRTETDVLGYFDRLFAETNPSIPVCIQDYPASTGVHLSIDCLKQLIIKHANIVMLKHEDYPGQKKLSALVQARAQGEIRPISIMVANSGINYPLELRRGADGVMTGFSFPEMLVQVFEHFVAGDAEVAEDIFDCYLPVLRYEFQPSLGLSIRKEILRRRGIIRSSTVRAPGAKLSQQDSEELSNLLRRLEQRIEESEWS